MWRPSGISNIARAGVRDVCRGVFLGEEFAELSRSRIVLADILGLGDQTRIRRMHRGLFFRYAPILPHFPVQELRIEIRIKQQNAVLDVVECAAQHLQFVGVSHDIGDHCVGEQPAAVRKNRALRPDHLAVGSAQVKRRGVTGLNETYSLGDECIEIARLGLIGLVIAAVIQQRNESRFAVGHCVGHVPHPAKRTIDELGPQVLAEQQHAVLDFIER